MAEYVVFGVIAGAVFVGTLFGNTISSLFSTKSSGHEQKIEQINNQMKNEVKLLQDGLKNVSIVEIVIVVLLLVIILVPSVYITAKCLIKKGGMIQQETTSK